jgi:hypothetical protein
MHADYYLGVVPSPVHDPEDAKVARRPRSAVSSPEMDPPSYLCHLGPKFRQVSGPQRVNSAALIGPHIQGLVYEFAAEQDHDTSSSNYRHECSELMRGHCTVYTATLVGSVNASSQSTSKSHLSLSTKDPEPLQKPRACPEGMPRCSSLPMPGFRRKNWAP